MPLKKSQEIPTPDTARSDEQRDGYSGVDILRLSKRNWLFVIFVLCILVGIVAYFTLRTRIPYSDYRFMVQGREIRLVIGSARDHEKLFQAASNELERIFARFSFFSPDSETTRLNKIPEIYRKTDTETFAFLVNLRDLSEKTLWHYDFTIGTHYRPYAVFELPFPESYRYPVTFSLEAEAIQSDQAFLFYFGKAVKGYALDRVFEVLQLTDPKVTGYCEMDGDIRFFGPKAGGADWMAGGWNGQELYLSSGALFQHPLKVSPQGTAVYEDHLILSPEKGDPINRYLYSAVIAPTALEAACILVAAQTLDPRWLIENLTRWECAGCLIGEGETFCSPLWGRYTYNH